MANKTVPGSHAFEYANSFVGKAFPLQRNGSSMNLLVIEPNTITTSSLWGYYYLEGTDKETGGSNSTLAQPPLYPNPFNITDEDFGDGESIGLPFIYSF